MLFLLPSPWAKLLVVPAGPDSTQVGIEISHDEVMTFNMEDYADGITVLCVPKTKIPKADFYVNGGLYRTERYPPYSLGGDKLGKLLAVPLADLSTNMVITCKYDLGFETGLLRIVFQSKPSPCTVVLPRQTKTSPLPIGFQVVKDGGLAFRANDTSTRITPPGEKSLAFTIRVNEASLHAFVVDMTTSHGVDHNDIWAKLDGGFRFIKNGKQNGGRHTGFTKIYHNANGRSKVTNTVDHDPHSLSSYDVLQPSKPVQLVIGGRSSQVIIHRILFFPCREQTCDQTSAEFKQNLRACDGDDA